MKFFLPIILILIIYIFIYECHAYLDLDEVNLAHSPHAICQCANSATFDPCRNEYKDWGIVNGTNMHSFNYSWTIRRGIFSERRNRMHLQLTPNFAILDLNKLTDASRMSRIFSRDKYVLFCSQSIKEDVESLNITGVKEVDFLPEVIVERKSSLDIRFSNIEKDLYFPSNFYNYDYKIYDYKIYDYDLHGQSQASLNDSYTIGPTINIYLYEVKNVYLKSHCISAKSTFLKMDGATSLSIDRTAIRNSHPELLSGLNLRYINRVNIQNVWGVLLTVESCSEVNFHPNSAVQSVHSIYLAHIKSLHTPEEALLRSESEFFVILNVSSWNVIGNDETTVIQNSTEEETTTTIYNLQNTFVMNDSKIIFYNNYNQDKQMLKYKINISNSTFERGNFINVSLTFIAHRFHLQDTNEPFPDWIHLCQINHSVTCGNRQQFRNICEIGFPYLTNKTNEEEITCQQVLSGYIPDLPEYIVQILVGLGLLLLLILTVIMVFIIYRYRKLSGTWSPGKGQGNTSMRPSTSFRQHQIIVLPSRDPHHGFNTFPRHFSSRLSPLTSQAGFRCYSYYDNCRDQEREIKENDKNSSVKSIPNVLLLNVNTVSEDVSLEQSNVQLNNET